MRRSAGLWVLFAILLLAELILLLGAIDLLVELVGGTEPPDENAGGLIGGLVILVGCGAAIAFGARAVEHRARVEARVEQVVHQSHSSRSGTWHTIELKVELLPPFDGHPFSTVHLTKAAYGGEVAGEIGTVLVNRSDPGYAELPGHQDYGPLPFTVSACILGGFLLLDGSLVVSSRRRRSGQMMVPFGETAG